ncbi:ribosome biogenesis GTPase Der [Sphaerobacter sp.]|uniref:ribosome biogenesis GTPase Der n=1 Tax=Sphaerobacter sp. TaxID=2099654 RepID=UPI001D742C15|nr:ribosome biogenesis GTPase Der [Sphaerobacter sp.]MBX5444508.1 ribosome biogenesis GTPase Der [Sphaerobacter sp.]
MARPLVAIVGRPNTGKSTLFNRLVGERRAIVEDLPGTTRDRIYAEANWGGVTFDVVDTGGLLSEQEIERASAAEIAQATQEQAELAIEQADVIVFMVDGQAGVTAGDHEVADLIRRSKRPVLLAVNKAEARTIQDAAVEFYELGLGDPYPISALHGIGVGDLLDAIVAHLPESTEAEREEVPSIAIVGRPNVGKSALLNALLGQSRQIVSPIPGTTRDAVDTEITWAGNRVVLVDTAGIRRPGRIERGIEKYSVLRSTRAVERADVAVLVIDATEPFTAQDQAIAGAIAEAKKGIIVAVNKWDLVEKDHRTMQEFTEKAREAFHFISYAPIVFISALTGQRVNQVMELALAIFAERQRRIPTGELNRVIRDAVYRHPPPTKPNKWLKIYYVTQADVNPPTFVFFVNAPQNVHFSYKRYLENTLRKHYGFTGTPIVMRFRARREDA